MGSEEKCLYKEQCFLLLEDEKEVTLSEEVEAKGSEEEKGNVNVLILNRVIQSYSTLSQEKKYVPPPPGKGKNVKTPSEGVAEVKESTAETAS